MQAFTHCIAASCLGFLLSVPVSAQTTQRVSVGPGGAQGTLGSYNPSISADGRYVAFYSESSNLVAGDTNGHVDVFVRDRVTGTNELVSLGQGQVAANLGSINPSISGDGRYVAFESPATNLVPGDTNDIEDVFVRDRLNGTTVRASVATGGAQADHGGVNAAISADGRYVAFESDSTNLVPGLTNFSLQIYVRDLQNGTTKRVSVDNSGVEGNANSTDASISSNGRFIAFHSYASNLVPGDTNGVEDIFVHDMISGGTERVSVDSNGAQANNASVSPWISGNGLFVAFASYATNLVIGTTIEGAYVHDRQTGTTQLVNVNSNGVQGNQGAGYLVISDDGRYVVFESQSSNLANSDVNGTIGDVFLRDLVNGTTEQVDVDSAGVGANFNSFKPSISSDGRYVAFWANASSLVPGDTNMVQDVFVRDRFGGTSFTSMCEPAAPSQMVIACPCGNAPASPDRGCDNSSMTGGAILSASGATYLSSDSLVLSTSGEKPTAFSIFSQGSGVVSTGIVFGQGVRCANLNLKRLYGKSAVGGMASAPGAGDPAVHTRSATLGDPIAPGSSRYYYVYYRDPIVLGGCPGSSTFNATQTGKVVWSP